MKKTRIKNWRYKALAQQIFSHLPSGEKINYICQKHITKNLPISKDEFIDKVKIAREHFDRYLKYSNCSTFPQNVFYEFGAEWDVIIPLSYYFFGVNSQIIIDIKPLIKAELVNHALKNFRMFELELKSLLNREVDNYINFISLKNYLSKLQENFGIIYKAPCDARNCCLESDSIDFISSTAVLEHIPKHDLLPILKECYRILKNGSIMSCVIDYRDHYSCFDNDVSVYNFIKYPDSIWKFYNSSLHYQNRLRHKDYIKIAENAGFKIIEDIHQEPTEEDIRKLKEIKLNSKFKNAYSLTELTIKSAHIILKK
jgi:SAM-dependent methyltransferase